MASKHFGEVWFAGDPLVKASHPGPVSPDSDALLVNSGRFMALSRDRPASCQSGKRLRVSRRDRARASPGNTFTRDPSAQLDSELEGPMPPAEALVERTRADTESVRVGPRRRFVLQFARDEDNNNGSGDEHQRSEPEEEFNEGFVVHATDESDVERFRRIRRSEFG